MMFDIAVYSTSIERPSLWLAPQSYLGNRDSFSDIRYSVDPGARSRLVFGGETESKELPMLSAIVLLNTERDKTNKVAEALADMDGVSEVYSVAGRYDLAAIVRASDNDQLAKVVTEHIRAVSGITSSETLIAFRVYSRHDLERMFSIGMEKV